MEIIELSQEEYAQTFGQPYHIYNGVPFNRLNAHKVDEVCCLAFKDKKLRMGIVAGITDGQLLSPFSAPFGGFQYAQEDIKIAYIEAGIQQLNEWATGKGLTAVKIVLPPDVYHESFIAKQLNSLLRNGYQLLHADINYQFPLTKFNEQYLNNIWENARYHYRKSLSYELEFVPLPPQELPKAYEIIAANRAHKGFPLRMTLEQVLQTATVIPIDAFVVNKNGTLIASAIVYRVNDKVAQVIYWGDLPGHSECRPMYFLSYNVFRHYAGQHCHMVDIGPSSENGVPNYGLCEFKESIGCTMSNKFTLLKKLDPDA